jgi:hypothetical protein
VTDYERFIGELTAATGVASPVDLARATVQRLKSSPDPVTKAFHYAQAVRNAAPWAFLDHRIWIDEPINDIMARFRAIFIHPVMQFRDQTLYHRDKGLCLVYVGRFVMNTFCRKLLFAGDTVVKLPFRAPPEELKFLREETLSVLHSVGINGLELYLESA